MINLLQQSRTKTEDDRMVPNLGGMSSRQGQKITPAISQPHSQVVGMAGDIDHTHPDIHKTFQCKNN